MLSLHDALPICAEAGRPTACEGQSEDVGADGPASRNVRVEAEFAVQPTQVEQPRHEQPESDDHGAADDVRLVAVLQKRLTKYRAARPQDHKHGSEAHHERRTKAQSRNWSRRTLRYLHIVTAPTRHEGTESVYQPADPGRYKDQTS